MGTDAEDARDVGFTLLETIVVVLLVSVLASLMVAVIAVIYRTTPSTETHTDDSRSFQHLVTWLPRDVASTRPIEIVFGSGATVCDGADVGVSLVQMTWTQNHGPGANYAADYRFNADPDGSPVTRYSCSGSGPTPHSGTKVLEVTGDVKTAGATSPATGVVKIDLTTCGDPDCIGAGPVITLEFGSRNPGLALP